MIAAAPATIARADRHALGWCGFLVWLAGEIERGHMAEFSSLRHDERARLALVLRAEAGPWGPH